ncbi:MAG: hypothetical protein H6733_17160 [Alphaproteobacteria bacterium]|nr:hypothetical protein [Alphaproteobacteria bacterium]
MRPALLLLSLALGATAHAGTPSYTVSVLVNAAGSGNLNAHQGRYVKAVPALTACAAKHAPKVAPAAAGAYALWTVTEKTGAASAAALQSEGSLIADAAGETSWGEEGDTFGADLTTCMASALAGVEGAGAGVVYVTVEVKRPAPASKPTTP